MPIKTSGEINFQDIVNEFGGSGEAALSEYYRGGPLVPNTNANIKIGTQGEPIALSQFYGARKEIILSYKLYGGGGAGGNGIADQTGSGTNDPGDTTLIMLKSQWDANGTSGTKLAESGSGGGGGHANRGSITGGAGGASDFGAGGSGGSPNTAGSRPTWGHWGAGGGGGGGDDGSTSYLNLYGSDAAGAAGSGGGASELKSGTLSIDVEVEYAVILGAGGTPSSVYNYRGGQGAPGHGEISLSLDNDATKYIALPAGDGSSTDHYTSNTVWILKITSAGQILWYKETDAVPAIDANNINGNWYAGGANEVDSFGLMEWGFRLNSNGTTSKIASGIGLLVQNPTTSSVSDWLPDSAQAAGIGGDYEAMVTQLSGSVDPIVFEVNGSAATKGQWYPLNQTFDAFVTASGRDSQEAQINLKIRKIGSNQNDVDQTIRIVLTTIPGM